PHCPLPVWLARTAPTPPPAAIAVLQSVWSVVAIVVLYRIMPIIAAAPTQTLRSLVYASAIAAVAAPLLAMVGNEPRRAMVLAGSGVAAIGVALVIYSHQASATTVAVFGVPGVLPE